MLKIDQSPITEGPWNHVPMKNQRITETRTSDFKKDIFLIIPSTYYHCFSSCSLLMLLCTLPYDLISHKQLLYFHHRLS